jgi:hypothetical protein
VQVEVEEGVKAGADEEADVGVRGVVAAGVAPGGALSSPNFTLLLRASTAG